MISIWHDQVDTSCKHFQICEGENLQLKIRSSPENVVNIFQNFSNIFEVEILKLLFSTFYFSSIAITQKEMTSQIRFLSKFFSAIFWLGHNLAMGEIIILACI